MKKWLALFLAFCMMGCCCAAAEEKSAALAANVQVNGDLALYLLQAGLMNTGGDITDEQLDLAENLIRLVNGLSLYAEGNENTLRGKVLLNERELVMLETDGQVMQTSLLPHFACAFPQTDAPSTETEKAQRNEQLTSGLMVLVAELEADLNRYCREAAEGEWTVEALKDTLAFDHRTVYEFTVEEMADALESFLSRAIPLLQTYLAESGIPPEAVRLNWNVTRPGDEAQLKAPLRLTLLRKKTDSGFVPGVFCGELTGKMPEETTLKLTVAEDQGEMTLFFQDYQGDGNAPFSLTWEHSETEEERFFMAQADLIGNPVWLMIRSCEGMDGGREMTAKLYVKSEDAPLVTLNAMAVPYAAAAPVIPVEKTLVDLEAMDEETSRALKTDMQMGLNGLLVNAIQAAPAEMQALLNAMTVPAE